MRLPRIPDLGMVGKRLKQGTDDDRRNVLVYFVSHASFLLVLVLYGSRVHHKTFSFLG